MGRTGSDQELLNRLQETRQRRMHFAFIAKGTSDGALILDQRTIPQAAIMIAKARSGGTTSGGTASGAITVIEGICFEEQGRTVFETAQKPPESMAAALKAVIQRDTGLALDPLCRIAEPQSSGNTPTGQVAYVGSEPNPANAPGYANLAPPGSNEAKYPNMAPNLTDTDAYANRLAEQEIDEAMRRRSTPPKDGG